MTSPNTAVLVIDVQQGFDDPSWGQRNNPSCEANVGLLTNSFAAAGASVILVRHNSDRPESPLHPSRPGNAFKPVLDGVDPALLISKHVHSAFQGDVDLHGWLQERAIEQLVVCGIQTNRCCETTARVAGDLGYRVPFALDATHAFDEVAHDGGAPIPAELISRVTATNLHGHFADVSSTADLVAAMPAAA